MIKPLIGAEVQNPVSANIGATRKKFLETKEPESFHSALAASTSPQLRNKHSAYGQTHCEPNGGRLVKRDAEYDTAKDKDEVPQTTGDGLPLNAVSTCAPELIANVGNTHDLFQIVFSKVSSNLGAPTDKKERLETINSHPKERNLENTGRDSDKLGFLTSTGKASQSAQQRMAGYETPRKGDAASAIAINTSAQEVKKAGGFEGLVTPPVQQAFSINSTADANFLPPGAFQQSLDDSAVPTSNDMVSGSGATRFYSTEMVEVLTKGFQPTTNSRTLRLQIDLPELGNISAHFGSGTDGVSVTLATKDQDSFMAVSELQREMKIWLDQANVETPDSGDLTGAKLETPIGSERQAPDRREENQDAVQRPAASGANALFGNDSVTLAPPQNSGKALKRWRNI